MDFARNCTVSAWRLATRLPRWAMWCPRRLAVVAAIRAIQGIDTVRAAILATSGAGVGSVEEEK